MYSNIYIGLGDKDVDIFGGPLFYLQKKKKRAIYVYNMCIYTMYIW